MKKAASASLILIAASTCAYAQNGTRDEPPVLVTHPFSCGDGLMVRVSTGTTSGYVTCVGTLQDVLGGRDRNLEDRGNRYFEPTRDTTSLESAHEICRSNPIDISSGKKVETEVDFSSLGAFPLELIRIHNSRMFVHDSIFGYKWRTNFSYSLHFDGTPHDLDECDAVPGYPECSDTSRHTSFQELRPDGRTIQYVKGEDGFFWEQKASPVSKAVRDSDGSWLLYGDDRTTKRFTRGGYLKEWKNQQGVGWTFTYGGVNGTQLQTISHTSGRSMQFIWTDRALTQIKDPAGHIYEYSYIGGASNGWGPMWTLKSVKYPGLPLATTTYHYPNESSQYPVEHRGLLGKSINGNRYSTFGYTYVDNQYRATSSEHAGGVERSTFAYSSDFNGRTVVEVNPLAKQTTYRFNRNGDLLSVEGGASANCAAASKDALYDGNGYMDAETDFNDNVTDYDYAPNGQLTKKVEALGTSAERTTIYTWDVPNNRILTETVVGDHETTYEYAPDFRVKKVSVKNLSLEVPQSQGRIRTTEYTYTKHPNGLVATLVVDGPLSGDAITYTYDAYGNPTQTRNELGHVTSFGGYDAMGRPGYMISPNGSRTDYTYDARGREVARSTAVNGTQQITTSTYDTFGRLAKVQDPDGHYRAYQYDVAGRIRYEWEPEVGGTFAQRVYTYNAMSLPTTIKTRRVSNEPSMGTVP